MATAEFDLDGRMVSVTGCSGDLIGQASEELIGQFTMAASMRRSTIASAGTQRRDPLLGRFAADYARGGKCSDPCHLHAHHQRGGDPLSGVIKLAHDITPAARAAREQQSQLFDIVVAAHQSFLLVICNLGLRLRHCPSRAWLLSVSQSAYGFHCTIQYEEEPSQFHILRSTSPGISHHAWYEQQRQSRGV